MNLVCANCEQQLTGQPFHFDGRPYCCAGCAGGGPCTCTYTATEPADDAETPEVPAAPVTEIPRLATTPPAETVEAPSEGAPPPPPAAARPAIVRASGFETQMDLLQFAYALEQHPSTREVTLVRGELADAWFAVAVNSAKDLAAALAALPGFEVSAQPAAMSVDVTASRAEPDEDAEPAQLLPPRPRFRLFTDEEAPEPAAAPAQPAAAPPAPEPAAAPEPVPATPAAAEAPRETVGVGQRPGGAAPLREHITLVVYPFHSFVALNEFQEAVKALRGIIDARVRRFYKGTLDLAVDYEDVIPLSERLADLEAFPLDVVSESTLEIEIMLRDEADVARSEATG